MPGGYVVKIQFVSHVMHRFSSCLSTWYEDSYYGT